MPGLPSLQQAGSVVQHQPHKQQRQSEKTQEGANQVPNPLCRGHGDAIHLEEACNCMHASCHWLHTCIMSPASHAHHITAFTHASILLHSRHQLQDSKTLMIGRYPDQCCQVLQQYVMQTSIIICGT